MALLLLPVRCDEDTYRFLQSFLSLEVGEFNIELKKVSGEEGIQRIFSCLFTLIPFEYLEYITLIGY